MSAGQNLGQPSATVTFASSRDALARRVLLVDDEPSACKLLSLILAPSNFRCVIAGNAEQALVELECERFDVVISDLRMPGMDGMELIREVRRLRRHIALLVTTGVDDVEVGVQAMRSGADDYLVKPIIESVVVASVDRALHKHYLEQQVEDYRRHLEEMVAKRTGQLRAALQRIEQSYGSTLKALGAAIDLRDEGTAGHSQRVCRYSREIAKCMGLRDPQLKILARGAYLHDIGKLGIPDSILLKPGPLTPEERQIMQTHVEIGFDVVKGIAFLSGAAEIILNHHERFDGSGYPGGLAAEQIPVGARIFAVADAFDAITTDRPYRRASSFEVGRATIQVQAGRHFDPNVVAAFLMVEPSWRHA